MDKKEAKIPYERAIQLLSNCIDWIAEGAGCADAMTDLEAIGFGSNELSILDYDYIVEGAEKENEEKEEDLW